jgi:hypothetical protein
MEVFRLGLGFFLIFGIRMGGRGIGFDIILEVFYHF